MSIKAPWEVGSKSVTPPIFYLIMQIDIFLEYIFKPTTYYYIAMLFLGKRSFKGAKNDPPLSFCSMENRYCTSD